MNIDSNKKSIFRLFSIYNLLFEFLSMIKLLYETSNGNFSRIAQNDVISIDNLIFKNTEKNVRCIVAEVTSL